MSVKSRICVHQSTKCGFSKKAFRRQYFFLFTYVLLTCYHHLIAKLGMYIAMCIFLNFWQVCNAYPIFIFSDSFSQIDFYFYRKMNATFHNMLCESMEADLRILWWKHPYFFNMLRTCVGLSFYFWYAGRRSNIEYARPYCLQGVPFKANSFQNYFACEV